MEFPQFNGLRIATINPFLWQAKTTEKFKSRRVEIPEFNPFKGPALRSSTRFKFFRPDGEQVQNGICRIQ